MKPDILKAYSRKAWISFFISVSCFLYLLRFSWLKWGDLIVDVGREMYIPLELLQGKLLYRDISYLYGPFSAYFNAVLFKTLGVHLDSLIAGGVITTCMASILIYKIARIFLNTLLATFAVLTFLFVFAFGQYVYLGNYNFILPYSYPAIHSILFSLAALYFFYSSLFKISRHKTICGIFILLTFLCRIEIGLMLTLSIMLTLVIRALSQREASKKLLGHLLTYVALPLVFAILIYGLFLINSFKMMQKSNLLDIFFKNINTDNLFTQFLSGTYNIPANAAIMLKVFLYYLFLCILFIIGGFIIERIFRAAPLFKKSIFSFAVASVFLWISFIFFKRFFTYDLQYRCLPLICLLTVFICAWKYRKNEVRGENLFIITISLFSLFLMARMLFRVWAGHYGFYILVPGMLVYNIFFFKIIAGVLKSAWMRRCFNLGFLFIFILFVISHFNISRLCYQQRTLKVSSPRGTLYVFDNEREERCKELIEFLRDHTDKRESLVVFPEGLTINFLSERNNPLYYYIYLPIDLDKPEVSQDIITEMKNKNVDYVALIQRDTSEYGYAIFGKDYAKQLWNYISENYILYKQFGPFPFTSQGFGIALFKRRA